MFVLSAGGRRGRGETNVLVCSRRCGGEKKRTFVLLRSGTATGAALSGENFDPVPGLLSGRVVLAAGTEWGRMFDSLPVGGVGRGETNVLTCSPLPQIEG